MPGYTIKGLDNLLEKLLEKIRNIFAQLEIMDISSKEYDNLSKLHDNYITDYSNLLDQRMELYIKTRNEKNRRI
jgi:hypothetical protein